MALTSHTWLESGSKGEAVERARNLSSGYHKLAIRHKLKL